MSAFHDAAARIAERGRPVFPCKPGAKQPLTDHGFKDATLDRNQIRRWWAEEPEANTAMPTGEPSGFVVLDVDGETGYDSLRELEHEHGALPPTSSVATPSGGQHFYFVWPGSPVPCTAGRLGAGLDVRGDGGYVLVPPSEVGGRRYERDSEEPVAPLPSWLLALVRHRLTTPARRVPTSQWERLARGVTEGERNDAVARVIGYLLAKDVEPHLAQALAIGWNAHFNRPPLTDAEVVHVCNSIMRAELARLG